MVDSLQSAMHLPLPLFAPQVEAFAHTQLGLNVLVEDMDAFRKRGQQRTIRYPNEAGEWVDTPITFPSHNSAERAMQAQLKLEGRLRDNLTYQLEAGQTGLGSAIANFAHDYAEKVANPGVILGNGTYTTDTSHLAGGYFYRDMPNDLAQAYLSTHVLLLDGTRTPHLLSLDEKIDKASCGDYNAQTANYMEMSRLHFAYHELAHAKDADEQSRPSARLQWPSNRDYWNKSETMADGFASLMMLRDFGPQAVPFLKILAMDSNAFHEQGDVAHYTAPIMLHIIEQAQTNMGAIQAASPIELFRQAQTMAEKFALKQGEPALLVAHRHAIETDKNNTPPATSPMLVQYENIGHVRTGILAEAQRGFEGLPNDPPAAPDSLSCRRAVDMQALEKLRAHGYDVERIRTQMEAPQKVAAPATNPSNS